jgi:hypothetical protein
LPACIRAERPRLAQPPASLARSPKAKQLIEAAEKLRRMAQRATCPMLGEQDPPC